MSTGTEGVELLFTPAPGARRRRAVNRAMELACTIATAAAVAVLLLVIVSVLIRGLPAISLHLFISNPSISATGQNTGGIANSIVGSVILILLASAIAIPIGILVAIYTTEFAGARAASWVRFALDLLNGVPTIVTGVFIFEVLIVGGRQSGWAAAIALAIVELPVVARSAQEVLTLVPRALHEAGLALGLRHWRIVLRVVLPTALGGLMTGSILGVARVAGETAPLLFTSSIFSNIGLTTNPSQAMPNVPVTIFSLSESPSPTDHAQAWAAALVLIVFVLLLSVIARAFHERSRQKIQR